MVPATLDRRSAQVAPNRCSPNVATKAARSKTGRLAYTGWVVVVRSLLVGLPEQAELAGVSPGMVDWLSGEDGMKDTGLLVRIRLGVVMEIDNES